MKTMRGLVLRPSARIQLQFNADIRDLVDRLTKETKREVLGMFRQDRDNVAFDAAESLYERQAAELGLTPPVEAIAMDASLAESMQRLIDRLSSKFRVMFDNAAGGITSRMVEASMVSSATGVTKSLKEISKSITLEMTPKLAEVVQASAAEATALIKRIPADYLPQVQGDVMRSITTGNGLQDLVPALEKQNVKIKNWSTNVARDQTRKVYNSINKVRMEESGVKKYEWIHSGGSNKPRKHHIDRAPGGLNGGIFRFDEPPIIDPRTGERGIPGQLPFCGCTMRPIIDFDDEE